MWTGHDGRNNGPAVIQPHSDPPAGAVDAAGRAEDIAAPAMTALVRLDNGFLISPLTHPEGEFALFVNINPWSLIFCPVLHVGHLSTE